RQKDLGSAEVFWRRTLKDVTTATAFSVEASHKREGTESYGEQRLTLSLDASTSLRQLARQHGLTLNILTQGAWALLLSRYTGERQVVFGNTVSGRAIDLAGVEEMVGVFINTLPVRVDVNESEEVLSWLKRLQAEQAEARQYEYTPVAEVQKWSGTGKGVPLFESILVFGNQPDQGDGPWAFADRSLQRTGYPIQILFEPGEKLSLRLTYQTHLFDEASIERLLSHYQTVLEDLLGQPRQRLAQLSILSDQERRELLFNFNDTETRFPLDRCFHELFEEQVKQTPDAPAAVCGNEEVSYAELNARANGVAMFLAERGVGPDVLVALLADRGIAFLTSVLGILKAGGAYLPLDPQHPARRISEVLKQSRVSLVLSAPEFASTVAAAIDHESQPQVILLDEAFASGSIAENLSSRSGRGNLAYVIYTSGSTGQPKGAMVEQAGMLNHLYAKITDLDLTPADTVAQTASQCFDISVWQFFAALLTGGCTHIFSDEIVRDPSQMLARLNDSGVSVLETVPSLLRMMVDEAESNKATSSPMAGLRWMIPTGEALPPALCRRWFDSHPQVPMLNAYGPTECSDDVSHYLIRNAPPEDTVNMPIGRPIANIRLYILREWLQPVPVGLSGELYVGGVGVGRGYLNDPARTAEVFVPDPYSGEPGARLYKTGDRARHLADHNIEFMGRVDTQVKVRGFRIELGDIEFALSQHSDVGEVVVIVREEQPGDKRLVAYLTPRQEKLPSVDELEKYLHERLPDYMKPAAFVPLKAMPLTPNGKIDRRRLPAVQYTEHTRDEAFTLPRNPVEQALAGVWSEVLGVKSIGVRDNFFRLGGDSILSIQVVAKAKQAGLRLSPAQLFSHQTIAELAEVAVTITEGEVADTSSPTIATLTPIQEWFFEQDYPTPHHWNQSVLLQSREPIVSGLMKRAVEALISHHDALRLRFVQGADRWEQRVDTNVTNMLGPFTSMDLSSETEQLETLQQEIAGLQSSLNFTHGPLLRVGHFSLGEAIPRESEKAAHPPATAGGTDCVHQRNLTFAAQPLGEKHHDRLLITVHHLVVDGVSWRILLEDLQTAYQQLVRGEEVTLPSRTTSYTRWATRLAEYAQSDEVRAEAAYWTSLVEQTHEPLPRDYATGENTVSSTRLLSVELSEDETQSLLRNVFGVSRTGIIDVLLAALLKTIAQWTGGNSLFAYLEGHGREEIGGGVDVSRTVGWFTTLYPLHLHAPSVDDVALLTSVKEQLRRLPNKGLGYGLLRYLSQNTETAARLRSAPEPEISFNYLGQFDQTISSTSGLTPAPESAGPLRSQEGLRGSLLDITSLVTNGRLRIDWHFSENLHRTETIERLAQDYIVALKDLITLSGGGYTLDDFPHASLSRDELDGLLQTQDAVEDIYRLSPLQQGILFDLRFTPQSGAYAMQLTQTLKGRLNASALKQALQQVVKRHSILRTSFHWEGLDEAVQVVHRRAQLEVVELDYTEKTERIEDYLQADRQRSFDLSKAPLMRAALLRTAEDSHEFVWSWHHLILDGWSFSILLKEIITIYNNLCDERVAPLRPARQYVDYINWLEQQELSEAESYWRGVLRGIFRTTVLAQHSGGDTLQVEKSRELSLETSGSMQQLAHNYGLTLNTLAQGAWALLLSRYTGERRVVFGSPVSGRGIDLAGVEEMVGVFINTLPVRVDVDESEEVLSWLKRLQAEQAEARQYEYTPLTDVQRWSDTEKGMPLFESLLVFKNTFTGKLIEGPKGGIEITNARAEHKTSLPLRLEAEPGERFVFRMVYDTGKFSDMFIEQILQHLDRLMAGMVSNPHQPLSELSLMTEKEQQQQQAFTDLASLEKE
ncbi:MAG TPA: amino acid adenylation domain-containing protein, partial [Pyrinomonadaceae bacterium]|nr:amino acid adenylation domain-containing protein [Pyrinomonadaceae bacterium]